MGGKVNVIRDCFESKEYGNYLWLNRIKKVWLKYQDGKTRPKRLNINSKGCILIVQEAETTLTLRNVASHPILFSCSSWIPCFIKRPNWIILFVSCLEWLELSVRVHFEIGFGQRRCRVGIVLFLWIFSNEVSSRHGTLIIVAVIFVHDCCRRRWRYALPLSQRERRVVLFKCALVHKWVLARSPAIFMTDCKMRSN